MSQQDTQVAEVDFSFRKNRETGLKRETVSLQIPVPTSSAIVEILQDQSDEGKKTRAVIMDAVHAIVTGYVRSKVDQDDNFNQDTLNGMTDDITLSKIANLPRSERSTVSKEELEQFAATYIALMPELSGISKGGAETAGNIFIARIRTATGNDAVLTKLQERLQEFVEKAPDDVIAEHSNAVTYLLGRLEEALGINYDANAL